MLRIRLCEESFIEPILNGTIKCPVHLYVGEEAIATGVCAALKTADQIFGTHRSHGHYLAKGGDLKKLVAEIYGKSTGCSHGRGGSMHVIDKKQGMMGSVPIVGGTIALALGAALAARVQKKDTVVVGFFGDGAMGEGVIYEALNFAALKKLPLIYVCENNGYSTHLPIRECRSKNNIWESAKLFGASSERVDGNNVLKVFEATKRAVASCRKGQGPAFLECMTYRLRGHVGPDDNIQGTHTDIRPLQEIKHWQKKDPLPNFERFLIKNKHLTPKEIAGIKQRAAKEVAEAHQFARQSPYPNPKELGHYVYKK